MINPRRIGILFNETLDAEKLLKGMRRLRPDARLVAIISPRISLGTASALADETIQVELSPLRLLMHGSLFSMIGTLRDQHFDLFVIRFDTLKLRLLAAYVSPLSAELWRSNGTITRIPMNVGDILGAWLRQKAAARARYLRDWYSVHFSRAK